MRGKEERKQIVSVWPKLAKFLSKMEKVFNFIKLKGQIILNKQE